VPLCAGATLADVGRAWARTSAEVGDLSQRADLTAVTYALAGRRFRAHDLLQVLPREVLMESREYYQDLFPEAFEKGVTEGEARGRVEGEARGETRGRAAGLALALLSVLAARDLPVTDAERSRILGCTDPQTLARWVHQAATAASTAAALA
jgi:predicted transposase YdaD